MNKIALITTSLFILIIAIGCAAAADLDVNDGALGSAMGGNGNNGPFYAPALGSALGGGGDNGPFYAPALGSALGGGGDNGPFYCANDGVDQDSQNVDLERPSIIQDSNLNTTVVGDSNVSSTIPPQYLNSTIPPQYLNSTIPPQYLGNLSPQWTSSDLEQPSIIQESLGDRRGPRGDDSIVRSSLGDRRGPRGFQPIIQSTTDVTSLGGPMGGGGGEPFY